MDIKKYIVDKKRLIDKALDRWLPSVSTKPQTIHKAMRYAVFPGGKRIRPVLTLASFEACGGKGQSIMPVACAIELVQSYTLIHDDLPCMDNDDYRRGKLACHKKFGEGLALLAGDALLTLSFQLLSETGNIALVKELSKAIGSSGTVGGQVVDIERQNLKAKTKKKDLDYIAVRKTGALFETAIKSAGIFEGVGKKKIEELSNFGKCIGFSFQLIDDLMDKDGYVALYGATYVRKMAHLLTERAKNHLKIFGKKADRLKDIAEVILKRES